MNQNREFKWISSKTGDMKQVREVDEKLQRFYSSVEGRQAYQNMLDTIEEVPMPGEFVYKILEYILAINPVSLLEIGCGNGRIYRQLRGLGFLGEYIGIEVAEHIIEKNKMRNSEGQWIRADAYNIPMKDGFIDMCFSYFVIEHLVYPERCLKEMLRVLKPGGKLVLVFPDFIISGRFASQELGLSALESASVKLKSGRILDAIISLYDSRIRLRSALRNVHREVGRFPINTNLVCFNHKDIMAPDIDAVYIASKLEIVEWAREHQLKYFFPAGTEGEFGDKAFIVLEKE